MVKNWLIVGAAFLLLAGSASAQVNSIGGATGNIAVDGITLDGNTMKLPNRLPSPILDRSINDGLHNRLNEACAGNSNCQITGDTLQLSSRNEQVWPGYVTYSGGWALGDTAGITFQWGGNTLTFSCDVGTTCGAGTDKVTIVSALMTQAMNSAAWKAAPFYTGGGNTNPLVLAPNSATFGYLTTYQVSKTLVVGSHPSSSTHGVVTVQAPLNYLDGPVGLLMYRNRPAGSDRMPRSNDYLGTAFAIHGPSTASPNGGIVYGRADVNIADPDTPTGNITFNTMCGGAGGAANGNGCLRMVLQQGLSMANPFDGSYVDHGSGSITVPGSGGIYIGNVGAMTATPNLNRWTINSSGDIAFSAPNLYNCTKGIKTDGNGVLSCLR